MPLLSSCSGDCHDCLLQISSAEESSVFLSKRDIENLTRGDIVDAPISTYRMNGKNVWILPTAMQRNAKVYLSHTFIVGDFDQPDQEILGTWNQKKLFENSDRAITETRGYKWITNTYQTDDGILAFVHAEYTGEGDYWGMPCETHEGFETCAPGKSKIGLAWMDTSTTPLHSPKFVYLGHIAGDTSGRRHLNVHGTPYLITDEAGVQYLNILFHDANEAKGFGQIAQARSPLKDVLVAAKAGHTSRWEKFNKGAWEDALTGRSSSVIPRVRDLRDVDLRIAHAVVMVHGDIVRHRESGKFILAAYTVQDRFGTPSRLVFYDSCDGINWRFNRLAHTRDDGEVGWSYLSLIDDNGLDNGDASGSFKLLAGFDYGKPKKQVLQMDMTIPQDCTCEDGE